MTEKTFVMIKPDHVYQSEEIFADLDNFGERVQTAVVTVSKELIEEHYSVHRDKPFFKYMTEAFVGKQVTVAIYRGNEMIKTIMYLCGPTDPSKAPSNTIRGKYSTDSLEAATLETRPCRNVIHRSDSTEEFAREFNVWKDYF